MSCTLKSILHEVYNQQEFIANTLIKLYENLKTNIKHNNNSVKKNHEKIITKIKSGFSIFYAKLKK